DDPALPQLLGGALVFLDHVDLFHEHAALVGEDAQNLAARGRLVLGRLVPALDDLDEITAAHMCVSHQMTSGASEMILVYCRSRSSRATGPKIRVPTGFSSGLMSTTALRSKRMYEPSLRR